MPTFTYALPLALFVAMLASMEIGRWLGRRRAQRGGEIADAGVGTLDGAVYALFGLIIAFIFSGATARFDHRRELITQEANAIGTAYLRVDLLPADSQATLRPLFRRYVESRIATYRAAGDAAAWIAEYQRDLQLQNDIWKAAVAGGQRSSNPAVLSLVIPALNEMIDITTTRLAATRVHPHPAIYAMLLVLGVVTSLLAGMSMAAAARRPWLHIMAFALIISATVYVVLDIEFPRLGFIRVDAADQLLVELLQSMR